MLNLISLHCHLSLKFSRGAGGWQSNAEFLDAQNFNLYFKNSIKIIITFCPPLIPYVFFYIKETNKQIIIQLSIIILHSMNLLELELETDGGIGSGDGLGW